MNEKQKKVRIVYHHNDLDGFMSAACIYKHFLDTDNYWAFENYFISISFPTTLETFKYDQFFNNEESKSNVVDEIYILDYSFTKDTKDILFKLAEHTVDLFYVDHHKTTLDIVEEIEKYKNITYLVNNDRSGAYLTYQLFNFNKTIPLCILLTDDYDRYIKEIPGSQDFNNGMYAYEDAMTNIHNPVWRYLFEDKSFKLIENIIGKGEVVYEYNKNRYAKQLKEFGYEHVFEGLDCVVVNTGGNSLAFGKKLSKYKMGIIYQYDGQLFKYSLYSTHSDVDCAAIARKYGGGGHKGAAGFSSRIKLV